MEPYPFVDFVEGYSGNTPLEAEKSQMNVFLASASGKGSLPAIINMLLEETGRTYLQGSESRKAPIIRGARVHRAGTAGRPRREDDY